MNRSLLIEFDEAWNPTVFINGETDLETAKLKTIADRIVEVMKKDDQ